jgi:hypothetical protein
MFSNFAVRTALISIFPSTSNAQKQSRSGISYCEQCSATWTEKKNRDEDACVHVQLKPFRM